MGNVLNPGRLRLFCCVCRAKASFNMFQLRDCKACYFDNQTLGLARPSTSLLNKQRTGFCWTGYISNFALWTRSVCERFTLIKYYSVKPLFDLGVKIHLILLTTQQQTCVQSLSAVPGSNEAFCCHLRGSRQK